MYQRYFFLLLMGLFFLITSPSQAQNNTKKVRYNYLTFLPENYDSLQHQLYPVIFYLHGRSVSGTNINRIKRYGLPFFLDRGKKMDFIVVAPQCPWGKNWASENWLDTIYSEVSSQYRIDPDRVYLTGMSLGGFGTWELANRYPHRFAAIAPLCGGGKTQWAENLPHLPVWVFHGTADRQVPVRRSDQMVEALKAQGAAVTYSRLKNTGHDIHRTYNNDQLYEWFLRYTRRPFPIETDSIPAINSRTLAEVFPQLNEIPKSLPMDPIKLERFIQ